MKKILNYIGQLRIYSLIDLILLLIATKVTTAEFIGVVCLHVGFLSYLESIHSHHKREKVPKWFWVIFIIPGIIFYWHLEVIPFLISSYFYTKKNSKNWGIYSPLFRGFQYLFLLGGITGFYNFLPWIVFIVILIRNFVGDMRDIGKDRKENMITLPMLLGVKHDLKHGHFICIILSSYIWWNYTNVPLSILLLCIFVEITIYNLTPR
jgi:4-hydroxybenzoate polyprenyltransferase